MRYDTACYQLALEFLNDSVVAPEQILHLADKLAQVIQDAIEDFMSEHEL